MYKPALNSRGEFLTAVAVGINRPIAETVLRLKAIGVDIIVIDTAHGHQEKMLAAVREARSVLGAGFPIAGGNIVTAAAAKDLILAGASILKVGVGPGAMCTTRMATGVGRPQFSAVREVAELARQHKGISVWADGGIRHPRDVALAIAAGAHSAFFGSWFAGTYESPADIKFDEHGRKYKENYGMASGRAVKDRNEKTKRFEAARRELFEEGISQSRMYLKPGEESAEDIIDHVVAGLRSACTYSGATSLSEFYASAIVGVQSSAGFEEGKPLYETWQ
jgi:IMP dehydrogenase